MAGSLVHTKNWCQLWSKWTQNQPLWNCLKQKSTKEQWTPMGIQKKNWEVKKNSLKRRKGEEHLRILQQLIHQFFLKCKALTMILSTKLMVIYFYTDAVPYSYFKRKSISCNYKINVTFFFLFRRWHLTLLFLSYILILSNK